MPKTFENHMVLDSCWTLLENFSEENEEISQKLRGSGFEEIATGVFVPEEDAYDYAMERVSENEDLKREFVEWFYSVNWIKEG